LKNNNSFYLHVFDYLYTEKIRVNPFDKVRFEVKLQTFKNIAFINDRISFIGDRMPTLYGVIGDYTFPYIDRKNYWHIPFIYNIINRNRPVCRQNENVKYPLLKPVLINLKIVKVERYEMHDN